MELEQIKTIMIEGIVNAESKEDIKDLISSWYAQYSLI